MLDRAGQIDHLPVGELEVRRPARRVVEVRAPGAAFDPTAPGRPRRGRKRACQDAQRPPLRLERIQVFDARADLARVRPARFPAAELEEPEHPARQELERPRARRERERLQPERRLRLAGRELQVAPPEEPGQPAVGAAQIQDQDARVVPERLDQKEVQREALARAGRAEHQRVADITGKQVVVVRRAPRGLQDRERLTAKVFALSRGPCGGPNSGARHAATPADTKTFRTCRPRGWAGSRENQAGSWP